MQGIALFCKRLTRTSYINRCSNVLRSEVIDAIEKSLQKWRNDVSARIHMFKAIAMLRAVYLQLININPEEYDDIETKINRISELWTKVGIF